MAQKLWNFIEETKMSEELNYLNFNSFSNPF